MLDGFGREEMDGFLRFCQLHAQAGEFLLESVEPLVHLGAKLLHFRPQLISSVLDFRPQLASHFVNLGADVAGE
ncbi:hypothetical protein DI43_03075 [Geobacillus sp. CAMR12739]|nr:hypothetical protein DI43_03075 [Geobacillus sp. CAMR12739]